MPLFPCFHLHLNHTIRPGLVTVGRYDGVHDSLTCATSGGKVFVHAPHSAAAAAATLRDAAGGIAGHASASDTAGLSYLSLNQSATALAAGALDPDLGRDVLLAGLGTTLLAYDVEQNRDMFYKEVPDGVAALAVGVLGKSPVPLALVGGNCSLQGFDALGTDRFWTVTGDNVSSMLLHDVTQDGSQDLIVASDDYDVRVFQDEQVRLEVAEDDVVRCLAPLASGRFAYGLGNGTIGVYDGTSRRWRVKSKHGVAAMTAFDLDNDGVPELITGWANGKLDVRNPETGEVVFRDTLGAPIAGVALADYRNDGTPQLLACSEDGEIRGYKTAEREMHGNLMDRDVESAGLAALRQTRQELLFELKTYEDSIRQVKERERGGSDAATSASRMPANAAISARVHRDADQGALSLSVTSSTPSVVVIGLVLASDHLFEHGAHSRFAARPSQDLTIDLPSLKDEAASITVKAITAPKARQAAMHVFETLVELPRFAAFQLRRDVEVHDSLRTQVRFTLPERRQRVALWVKSAFMLENVPELEQNRDLDLRFIGVQEHLTPLRITVTGASSSCEVTMLSDDVHLLGSLVQDLCAFAQVAELDSMAALPGEMHRLALLMQRVGEYNAARQRISAELADGSNVVKAMVIQAEDARLLGDMPQMRRAYAHLFAQNMDLVREYKKRASNHQELLASLRDINQAIQRASRLRCGAVKARVIAACRQAVKTSNLAALEKAMQCGGRGV